MVTMEEVIRSRKAQKGRLRCYKDEEEEHILLIKAEWKVREEGEGDLNSSRR